MTNVTQFELIVLNAIARHEMNSINGDIPASADEVSTFCWPEDFTGGELAVNQVKGVLSSLVQKEWVEITEASIHTDGQPLVDFTDDGFKVWQKTFNV